MALNQKDFPLAIAGERTNAEGKPISNKILLRIPDDEFAVVRPHLARLELAHHLSLHEPGQPLDFACFPNRGLVSTVVAMKQGRSVETGVIGKEGCVGASLAVGVTVSPLQEIVQMEGDACRLARSRLEELLPSMPQFRLALLRFAVLQGIQTAQTAACNRLHEVQQRLARWLLMVQDRVDTGWLAITHDFLATMLGTDRPTVSLAAATLQERQAIEYVPRAVRVLDHKKLEESACECYGVIQQLNGDLGLR